MGDVLERILYVDDEPHMRELARLCLEKVGGFTTCICESGLIALEAAAEFRPNLILLDVMMPVMDGPQTLAAIRTLPGFLEIPAVFVTAKAQSTEIERLMKTGARAVISKPFAPLQLADILRSVWNGEASLRLAS